MTQEFDYERHTFKAPELESIVRRAVDFFTTTPVHTFPPTERIVGAGVYALYYFGDFEPYAPIAEKNRRNWSQPIYVGKAVLPGNRTGFEGTEVSLLSRLRQHSRSINAASTTLRVEDFKCRFAFFNGIEHDLIGTVETGLIKALRPLWNSRTLDGFGNHDPGKGRYDQQPSAWDILHPGRKWVLKLTGVARDPEMITASIRQFLAAPQLADMIETTDDPAEQPDEETTDDQGEQLELLFS